MAKTISKKHKTDNSSSRKGPSLVDGAKKKNEKKTKGLVFVKSFFKNLSKKSPHKSFRRTYREDYARDLNIPGMGQQIFEAFSWIFRERKLFLDAVSCKGRVQFTETLKTAKKCYKLTGEGKDVLADLLCREVGYDRKECFYSPLCPDRMWHLLLRNAGIAVTVWNSVSGEEIDAERFLIKDCDKRVAVYEKEVRHLEEEAMECLGECKKIHDELEEIYKSNVDFTAVTEHTERLLSLVFPE